MASKKILVFGRIVPYKGVHKVIEALSYVIGQYPDIKLLITGQLSSGWTKKDYDQYLRELIKKFDLSQKVEYSPRHIPEGEKRRLLRSADLIIYPSLAREGFGIGPLEGLKYNGIVISSDIFIESGSINSKVAFVYPRESVKELARQIIKALSLTSLQQKERKRKAKEWASNFTWQRHVDELEKVFKDLIEAS